jgi:drug/metabolite transporter (DMT)-like permease
MRSSRETRAFILLLLVTFVWAGLMPTGKVALRSVPPLTIAALRMTLGSVLLRLYLQRHGTSAVPWSPRLVGSFLFLGFVGYFVGVGCSYYGLRQTTATNAALLNAACKRQDSPFNRLRPTGRNPLGPLKHQRLD